MKRFEAPILKVEKFNLVNIITASGETPVEPTKENAVVAATEKLGVSIETQDIFQITL